MNAKLLGTDLPLLAASGLYSLAHPPPNVCSNSLLINPSRQPQDQTTSCLTIEQCHHRFHSGLGISLPAWDRWRFFRKIFA